MGVSIKSQDTLVLEKTDKLIYEEEKLAYDVSQVFNLAIEEVFLFK